MDANRRGQPGWLWGVLAIPFGWLAILAYVVTRAVTSAQSAIEVLALDLQFLINTI